MGAGPPPASALLGLLLLGLCWQAGPPHGDFANYYTAAALWWAGTPDLTRLYDYRWFTGQAAAVGFRDQLVGFVALTPPSALLAVPLLPLGPEWAGRAWWAAQTLQILALPVVLARTLERPLWWAGLLVLAVWPTMHSHLVQGQAHLPAVLALALGMLALRRAQPTLGGGLWALAVGLKIHAWPLLLLALLARQGRVLLGGLGVLALGGASSVLLLGVPLHLAWLADVAPAAGSGWVVDPWHLAFQSVGSVARNLLVPMPGRNTAWIVAPRLAAALPAATLALVVGLSAAGGLRWAALDALARQRLLAAAALSALVSGAALLTYHLTLLLPPLAWAVDATLRQRRPARAALLVLLAAVAVRVPVPTFADVTDPLAFFWGIPRFWLLLALWAAVLPVRAALRPPAVAAVLALAGLAAVRAAPPAWVPLTPEATRLAGAQALVCADLRLGDDGVLRWSGLASDRAGHPGHGWVGYALGPDADTAPAIVAWDAVQHLWSPAAAGAWGRGAAAVPLAGGVRPGPGGGTLESRAGDIVWVAPDGVRSVWLTRHPATDTEPVWDPARQRIWFLSDRGVGVRAAQVWWLDTRALR